MVRMNNKPATILALVVLGVFALAGGASANGTIPDGNGGAVCKGMRHCTTLAVECKGTYTPAIDAEGNEYGKCTKVRVDPAAKKVKAN
ncbi:hypothetical protein VW23_022605 [Devosia insulae DS-56]|uniref:DUF2282 domain-containing protein n=1 Tax=Devosia insulae DS-56 TaxID=1116389 RepID=A0A1E5XNJ0_9HYPH|nr:hypothetical protein [Devosia insulae]OEO30176.1 hypothetical protein VW23_022605 [Devosia insulae DS-56]